jgi:hypothetical protein
MGWAQRLKRVFSIEIERCGGGMKIIAAIENAELRQRVDTAGVQVVNEEIAARGNGRRSGTSARSHRQSDRRQFAGT